MYCIIENVLHNDVFIIFFYSLVTFKVLISIVLAGKAVDYINENKEREKREEQERKNKEHNLIKRKSSWDPSYSASKVPDLHRSKSVGAVLHKTHKRQLSDDVNIKPSVKSNEKEIVKMNPPLAASQSKALFSNSTVSLESMGLNEELIKDKESPEKSGTELKHRGDKKKKEIPLHEIDRYDMCSNRII